MDERLWYVWGVIACLSSAISTAVQRRYAIGSLSCAAGPYALGSGYSGLLLVHTFTYSDTITSFLLHISLMPTFTYSDAITSFLLQFSPTPTFSDSDTITSFLLHISPTPTFTDSDTITSFLLHI